jgi:hypothetical protein
LKPSSTYEPSEINSLAHRDEVRMNIEAALDEHRAINKMSANDRMGIIIDAKYGDTDLGDIFRNRAAEERGETNTIRSDLGNSISEAYDNVTANAIDEHEGTAT